jgi:membrane protease YdiL (CAAX protease family)
MGMIFFNVIIAIFLGGVSSNESQVREMLYNNVFFTMISISIYAPLSEELIFRKSLRPLINNKWIYIIVSGLLFGGAHILTNFIQNTFVLTDLIYILPYGCLGAYFALMDYESKTTFSSIVIHALHNTCTACLLLAMYYGGLV